MKSVCDIGYLPVHQTNQTDNTCKDHNTQNCGCSSCRCTGGGWMRSILKGWERCLQNTQIRYWILVHLVLAPTYCHTDSSARHGEADVIGQGDVDAKHPGVVEELTEDQLTIWRRRGCITDGFHRCDAVSVRNDRAHFIWQTETKTFFLVTEGCFFKSFACVIHNRQSEQFHFIFVLLRCKIIMFLLTCPDS